jgi:hypothetical protein
LSSANDRLRLHRSREANGQMVLRVLVDHWQHVDLLVRFGLLKEWDGQDRRQIEIASAKFLALAAADDVN